MIYNRFVNAKKGSSRPFSTFRIKKDRSAGLRAKGSTKTLREVRSTRHLDGFLEHDDFTRRPPFASCFRTGSGQLWCGSNWIELTY